MRKEFLELLIARIDTRDTPVSLSVIEKDNELFVDYGLEDIEPESTDIPDPLLEENIKEVIAELRG